MRKSKGYVREIYAEDKDLQVELLAQHRGRLGERVCTQRPHNDHQRTTDLCCISG
jgi:hypothetical protein